MIFRFGQVGGEGGASLAKSVSSDLAGGGIELPFGVLGEECELSVLHEDEYDEGV